MGLFRTIHDWFLPHVESTDECLRRGVREQVHSVRNQLMIETAAHNKTRDELSELARCTRRLIKRMEIARLRAEKDAGRQRNDETTNL
jgi:hypothetical protein